MIDRGRFQRDALLADASARTGLRDFGTGIDDWQDCLDALVASTLDEAELRDVDAFRDFVLHHLANRLRIQDCLVRFPEIHAQAVPRPLFISGLPRAGTTTFSRLIGEDPRARTLRLWELHSPAPTDLAHPWALTEDRLAAAERLVLARARQGTLAIRPISLFLADECFYLMRNSFDSDHLHRADARRPSYFRWLDRRDRAGTYAYYRTQLQLLLWQRGCPADGQVVLKNPFVHLENLRTIFALFPDAIVLNLTRDIASVVASLCFKNRADRTARSVRVSAEDVGADMVENLDVYYRRRAGELAAISQRDRILTIDFDAWAGDPVAIMRQVYARTGQPFDDTLARAMAAALGRHARYGEQARYDLAEFGLRADALRERFAPHEAAFRAQTGVVA